MFTQHALWLHSLHKIFYGYIFPVHYTVTVLHRTHPDPDPDVSGSHIITRNTVEIYDLMVLGF